MMRYNPRPMTDIRQPTQMEDYLFDLRGYLVLKDAVSPDHVAALNQWIDDRGDLTKYEKGEWIGGVEVHGYQGEDGINFQNVLEGGPIFEKLIDHPSWIGYLQNHYINKDDRLYIDEAFLNVRPPGGFINIHSGGDRGKTRTQYLYRNGRWSCGQVNVILALTDIGPGDGGTVVIPGSHKSNLPHPMLAGKYKDATGKPGSEAEGTVEVHMKAGSALMFVDCLCHGSAARTNEGDRRVVIYRYGPYWGFSRFGYYASEELLERLTPERRAIVQPIKPRRAPQFS